MAPNSAELAEEQAYFDLAQHHRERHREALKDVPGAAVHAGAAQRLRAWVSRRQIGMGRDGDAVAVGRIDDESGRLYVGRETIVDDRREVLVVNWRAPAAQPYYEATHANPCGLVRKRIFECRGNQIIDFQDVVFQRLAADVAKLELTDAPDALLLAELEGARSGAMRDIVATIHAAQYQLIRAPIDQVLVIEGGAGTGKTAVALHRVSWLLFNHRDRLAPADVLVVGPHPAFTRYIENVLPGLGDTDVVQQDIGQLAPTVQRGLREPGEVRRIKGEARMASLLARALEARIGAPEPAERLLFDGRFVTLSGVEVAALLASARQGGGPYAQRRKVFHARLLVLVRERGAPTDRDRLAPLENLVERLWPQLSAPAFLRDLLGSRLRLAAAGGDEFTAEELALLHRRGADRLSQQVWSEADLPLLDEAEELINGVARRYAHIVVDEAQDLAPMQLRAIARRSSNGSMTVVGDLAQSTGPWARDGWDELARYLPTVLPHNLVSLRYGYRVPRQIYQLAARLLPVAAPSVQPTEVVRDGPADPGIHRVPEHERAGRVVAVAAAHAEAGRFVGIVCPEPCRAELEEALAAAGVRWSGAELASSVNVVEPTEVKGLEFDAVVVVEPELIVAGDERGHRLLYVALTRTTRYLDIVCVGEPVPLTRVTPQIPRPRHDAPDGPDPVAERLDPLAGQVAALVAGGAPAPLWDEVLQRAAAMLDQRGERHRATGRHRRE